MNYPLYNNTLCPRVWEKREDEYQMRPEIREALLSISKDFIKDTLIENAIKLSIKDIFLIGSMTNFNWTPFSDFDLHILVDFAELDMSPDEAKVLVDGLKSGWNKNHAITIKGHPVELYIQDVKEPNAAMSIYSIKNAKWIKEPVKQRPTFDKKFIQTKHKQFVEKLTDLFKTPSEKKLETILERIHNMRQAGLDKKGEFSEENIVFKILRAQGYLDKIKTLAHQVYDKEHSIEETEKIDDAIVYDSDDDDISVVPDEPGKVDMVPTENGAKKRVHNFYGHPILPHTR